jgi:hypothetical protein
VALGDYDGDGDLDILTANAGSRNVSLFLGDGRGRFRPAPALPLDVDIAPHLIALADFDRNGRLDFAVTGHDSNDVVVMHAGGLVNLLFVPIVAIEGVTPHNHGLAVADFNVDGVPDLATSNNSGNSVSVLLGKGGNRFSPAPGSPFRVGRAPYPLGVADFNGDGKPDVATPDVNGDTVSVLFGDGRGSLAPAPGSPYRIGHRPYFALAARVNADRAPDLVVSHDDIHTLTVLLNDGRGRFPKSRKIDAGGQTWKLRSADFDGDGHTDLAMGIAPASLAILFGDGAGNFRPGPGSTFRVGRGPYNVAIGDIDRNGKTDVVTANTEDGTVSVLLAVSSAAKP